MYIFLTILIFNDLFFTINAGKVKSYEIKYKREPFKEDSILWEWKVWVGSYEVDSVVEIDLSPAIPEGEKIEDIEIIAHFPLYIDAIENLHTKAFLTKEGYYLRGENVEDYMNVFGKPDRKFIKIYKKIIINLKITNLKGKDLRIYFKKQSKQLFGE